MDNLYAMRVRYKIIINTVIRSIFVVLCFLCFSCNKKDFIVDSISEGANAEKVTVPINIRFNNLTNTNNQNDDTAELRDANNQSDDPSDVSDGASPQPITINDVAIFAFNSIGDRISSSFYTQADLKSNTIQYPTFALSKVDIIAVVNAGKEHFKNLLSLNEAEFKKDTVQYKHNNTSGIIGEVYTGITNTSTINPNSIQLDCYPLRARLNVTVQLSNNYTLKTINLINASSVAYQGEPIDDKDETKLFDVKGLSFTKLQPSPSYNNYKINPFYIGDNVRTGKTTTTAQTRVQDAPKGATYIEVILSGNNSKDDTSKIYLGDLNEYNNYSVKHGNSYDFTINTHNSIVNSNPLLKYNINIKVAGDTHTLSIPSGFIGTVNWGDGSSITQQDAASPTKVLTHIYSLTGEHTVKILGSWKNTDVQLDLSKNGFNKEEVTLLSLGGDATEFSAEQSSVIADVDKDFFKASSKTLNNLYLAFSGCVHIKEVPLLKGYPLLKNVASMFQGCTSLTSINKVIDNCPQLAYVNSMFQGCTGLKKADNVIAYCPNLETVSSMFEGCTLLNHFGNVVTNCPKLQDMSSMFQDCTSLTRIDDVINNCSQLTYVNSMFKGCTGLNIAANVIADCPNLDDLSSMFEGCTSLSSITNLVVNCMNISKMNKMFYGDTSLYGYFKLQSTRFLSRKDWNTGGAHINWK